MRHHYLTLLSALLILLPSAAAQTSRAPQVTTYKSPIKGEIESAIRRETEKSRLDDPGNPADLSGIAERIDEAFPFLDDYLNDPSEAVKSDIVWILSRETSERSLKLIVRYLTPNSGPWSNAPRRMYEDYSKDQVVNWGGAALQRALFLGAKADPDPQAILLLSCFGASARPQLNEIRKLYPNTKVRFGMVEGWLSAARITFYCDLALTQIEDAAALTRLKERLALGSANDRATLLAASKFLNTKPLLRLMVSFLQDKRDFRYYQYFAGSREKPRYSRIADIAWGVLRYKTGTNERLDLNSEPKTDAALRAVAALAFNKLAL